MPDRDVAYAWAPITKMEKDEDGTLMVYGPAASSDLDRDQQRLNAQWLDQAMPAWFSQGANVREQHDSKRAVGVGVGLTKGDDGTHLLAARIVDPIAVTKCEHKVLKGFSVGIKGPKITLGKSDAPGGEIVGGDIIEVSVVDRPSNPTTLFEIAKADGAGGELEAVSDAEVTEKSDAEAFGLPQELYDRLATPVKEALAGLAVAGAVVNGGESVTVGGAPPQLVVNIQPIAAKADASSYPIKTKADLRKAIKAVGRGADRDELRSHIIKRATALGLEAMVPTGWNSNGSLASATKADEEIIAKAEQILREARALAPTLVKADDEGDNTTDPGAGGDIASADEAITCIARLIIPQAEAIAGGNLERADEIELLLSSIRSLKWFRENLRYEAERMASKSDAADATATTTPVGEPEAVAPVLTTEQVAAVHAAGLPPGTVITADVVAEAVAAQTASAASTEAEDTTQEGEPAADGEQLTENTTAVTKADLAELVKAAVAEVTTASEERTKALEADLAKANAAIEEFRALPTAGGPALTRTAAQQAQAQKSDADRLRQQAKALLAKADKATDGDLRDGYRDRAKALLAKADA